MHFCVSAARVSLRGIAPAHLLTSALFWPRKMGTNWFMPALVNRRFGESGMRLADGTMVCCFDSKNSRNDWRISDDVIMQNQSAVGTARAVRSSQRDDPTKDRRGLYPNPARLGEWKFLPASAGNRKHHL